MKSLRLPYNAARITTTEEIFLGKLLVSIAYDGIFIGAVYPDGVFWRDSGGHRRLSRERAIRATVRQCHHHMTTEQYATFVQREGGHL
ncbi:MAG: hypothetical protein H0X24_16605 [Ktedonobacterales bacterium]|nr:hypothetical protein [Ktedonobacterales bacterium]